MQSLQTHNTSAQVTIPKDGLRRDGVLGAGTEIPDDFEQNVVVDRLGKGQYLVRLVDVDDQGKVPDLLDAEVVQRAAAQLILNEKDTAQVSAN